MKRGCLLLPAVVEEVSVWVEGCGVNGWGVNGCGVNGWGAVDRFKKKQMK